MRSSSTLFSLFVFASLAHALSLLGTGTSATNPASDSGITNLVSNILGAGLLPRRTSHSLSPNDHHGHRHRHSHNGKAKPHVPELNATAPAAPAVKHASKPQVDSSPLSQLLPVEPQNEKRVIHGFGLAMGRMKRGFGLRGVSNIGGIGALDTIIAQLRLYHGDILGNSDALLGLLNQSHEASFVPTHQFQTDVAGRLIDIQTSLALFSTTLHTLGDYKGLCNYDRSNDLETVVKDVINFHKDVLTGVSGLVYQTPVLGAILGPIVYSLKCTLDDVLNATENMLDGVMNIAAIQSVNNLLHPLIAITLDTMCGIIALKGICVL